MSGDVTERLAAALAREFVPLSTSRRLAAALLPVVEDLRREAAAEALEEAADDWDANTNHVCDAPRELRDRATALRAEP